jgi:hypothetical protein
MGIVMFHSICDKCGKHGEEYCAFAHCAECLDDLCPNCIVPDSLDEETGKALCWECNQWATEEEAA